MMKKFSKSMQDLLYAHIYGIGSFSDSLVTNFPAKDISIYETVAELYNQKYGKDNLYVKREAYDVHGKMWDDLAAIHCKDKRTFDYKYYKTLLDNENKSNKD